MEWCSLNNICGGCTYGGMTYEEQLAEKEKKLTGILEPAFDENSVWEGVIPSPLHERYKNKMEYSFGNEVKDGPLTLGMHKRKSFYSVVTCDDCRIADEDYNRIIKATVMFFRLFNIPFVHKKSHEGYLRHMILRRSFATGDVLVDLVTADMPVGCCALSEDELLEQWKTMLLKLELDGQIAGILHTRNNSPADAVIDEGTERLYGRDFIVENCLGLSFKVTPFSFFQTNSKGAEELYSKIREYVGDTTGKTVYDLYSGTGTIAQLVAPVAEKVYGVEIVAEAVEAAKENAKDNGLDNCEFIAGDVLNVIDGLEKKPDIIILDPPRDGLHPKMLPKIAAYGIEKIVYVACKPESFVRDMEYFKTAGYRVERAAGCDMFPYTKHCEAICLISKRMELQ
ncbi:MAG: 23S rRNA (uracil(1939)-C(5))-methyltransferase RlmD [Lachnospiraceae bacterium]|nr:23S rRNA (uracil(1939)-C(5))-methyltransferase RlmD [Lachnospiraceae bacterium]